MPVNIKCMQQLPRGDNGQSVHSRKSETKFNRGGSERKKLSWRYD